MDDFSLSNVNVIIEFPLAKNVQHDLITQKKVILLGKVKKKEGK